MDAVVLENVTKRYNSLTAVDGLSFAVREGAVFGLLGPNGAGKTTTLRMILRVLVPDEGRIDVLGEPLNEHTPDRIGYLPEERGLYARMKLEEVLVFLGALKGLAQSEARRRAGRWLERMELGGWAGKKVSELSKGMQQKAQIVAALIHEPPLVILDEPFTGLDPVNATLVKNIMLELRSAGTTIILSTHRMEQVEMMCDAICLVHRGRNVLAGDLRAIKQSYGKNTLRLEISGNGDFLERSGLVEAIHHFGAVTEARLKPGADPQEILRAAVRGGTRVTRFELVEPPLHDIFIEKVSEPDA